MAGPNAIQSLATELNVLLDPLRTVFTDPAPPHELAKLLRSAGWTLPGLAQADLSRLTDDIAAVIDEIASLPTSIASGSLIDTAESLQAIGGAIQAVRGLAEPFETLVSGLLGGSGELAPDLVDDLWQLLVIQWIARRRPTTFRVLRSLDIISNDPASPRSSDDGVPVRSAKRVFRFEADRIVSLVRDPIAALRSIYVPEKLDSSIDAQVTALMIGAGARPVIDGLGGNLAVLPPWGALRELPEGEQDAAGRSVVVDLPLPSSDGSPILPVLSLVIEFLSERDQGTLDRPGPGIEASLQGLTSLSATRGTMSFDLDVAATAGTVFVSPSEAVGEAGGTVEATATISRSVTAPMVLGADGGTRLELGTPTLRADLILAGEPDVEIELVLIGAALVVSVADGDSFLAGVLPSADLRVDLDLGLVWSRLRGLRLSGSPELSVRLPVDIGIAGVLTLEAIVTGVELTDTGLSLVLVVDGSFELGPFTARVEGVGLRVIIELGGDDGNLGFGNLSLAFQPPYGFGFEILIGETVIGGGFVRYQPEIGRYSGALALEFLSVGLSAIVVVDTRLPGDPHGWALFASLFATFPSLPLGFGFFLSGVGGIVCLNRTMDAMAIAAGLRDGAVDAILFPDNPLDDAPFIISQLDAWFPLADGSTVFGLAATITWGTPKSVITAQLGIMLSLPELELAVLGSITMMLPDEDAPVLELHMDTIGTLDVAAQTVMVVASLYDSTLLQTIHLSGDMAMYGQFGGDAYFLLSVGGYNPNFKPPKGLPPAVLDLRRMRAEISISEDVWFAIEAYLAVTSNTLQFGALASLEASARFTGVTYTARGCVGFDVLLVFVPFSFVADFYASVAITAGSSDRELLAVSLGARLEGPEPWYTTGYASFDFLGIGVRFEFAAGAAASVEAKPRQNVLDLVIAALQDVASWSGSTPGAAPVVLADDDAASDGDGAPQMPRIRPDADIDVRQTVAPLDRTMDVYGIYAIDGPTRLDVTGSGITGLASVSSVPVSDWFAPAQYDVMSRVDRLSAPSYELMDAGVRITADAISWGDETQSVTPTYEVKIIEKERTRPLERSPQLADIRILGAGALMDPARAGTHTRTVSIPQAFAVEEIPWVMADGQTGTPVGASGPYRQTLQQIDRLISRGASARGDVIALPAHATRGAS